MAFTGSQPLRLGIQRQLDASSDSPLHKSVASAHRRSRCSKSSFLERRVLDRCLRLLAVTLHSPMQSFKVSKYKESTGLALQELKGAVNKESFHRQRLIPSCAGLNEGSGFAANSNTGSYTNADSDLEETRSKLNASLQLNETGSDYVQALHESARKFQLAMEQHGSSQKHGWFAKSWLGVDHVSWIKPLAYQAAVHALLQAVLDIASRGDGGDRDTHVFVQRSISRQLTPLQGSINQQFRVRKSSAEDWFWSQQHPLAVASFVDILERDSRFTAVTSVGWEGVSVCPSKASDVSLITLALSTAAAIVKLGAAKLSCPHCFSTLVDEIARLMNTLVEFLPIDQVYSFTSSVGLRSQFLDNFGPRAIRYQDNDELGGEEGAFWVDLVQQLLRGAIVREHIRMKLTSYDSIEVLERDLAVFGFLAAMSRRTQSFLLANGFIDLDERIAGLLRYLIGGSTLFYPQLASLNTFQFFIEVVCEEMNWLPFYPISSSSADHSFHAHNEPSIPPNREAISKALEQCSRWIYDFIKYSTWIQQPGGGRAKTFLLKCKSRLDDCVEAYSASSLQGSSKKLSTSAEVNGVPLEDLGADGRRGRQRSEGKSLTDLGTYNRSTEYSKGTREKVLFEGSQDIDQLKLFDAELQGVDMALSRLEHLLLEQQGPGKEHLTAACTNLKTIRQLKKEVETLEASLREKSSSMPQVEGSSLQRQRRQKNKRDKILSVEREIPKQQEVNRTINDTKKLEGIAKIFPFLARSSNNTLSGASDSNALEGEGFEQAAALALQEASTSKEIQHFEVLRHELMDLERRIQESAGQILNDRQESECQIDGDDIIDIDEHGVRSIEVVKADIVSKSLQKIKDTSTDVWKGTQLLATDVAAAVVLLRRSAAGEELTEKEKNSLKRTLTDLASIIPIGFLMLLPVTAVGHAAILAAIQRYVPALIPSAYAHERLELMKQLEKVKEMESAELEDDIRASSTAADSERGRHLVD